MYTCAEKMHVLGHVLLVAARILCWVHCSQKHLPAEDYMNIDSDAQLLIQWALGRRDSHSWSLCDPITLLLWYIITPPGKFHPHATRTGPN
jgi:hypothetical protein